VCIGVWARRVDCRSYISSGVRDIETIDGELRLLVAIRRMIREAEGRPPCTARIDELLDARCLLAHSIRQSGYRPCATQHSSATVAERTAGTSLDAAVLRSFRSVGFPRGKGVVMDVRLRGFGSIEVEGELYEHDVVIDRGIVRKRSKKPSKPYRDKFGHTPLSTDEALPWGGPRLIIGTGPTAHCRSCLRWWQRPRTETLTLSLSRRNKPAG
jgi:hypothetical protein